MLSVGWSRNGRWLATGSRDGTAKIWNAATWEPIFTLQSPKDLYAVAWSPNGKRLATGGHGKVVTLWDANTGREVAKLGGHSEVVYALGWSPDGTHLAVAGGDKKGRPCATAVKIWNVEKMDIVQNLAEVSGDPMSLAWSPDNRWLATDRKIWDVFQGECIRSMGTDSHIFAQAWAPDGQRLAVGYATGSLGLWDAKLGVEMATISGHAGAITCVAWSPDGRRLLTGSEDTTARIWETCSPCDTHDEHISHADEALKASDAR